MKHCNKCGETKPLDEFHNKSARKDGKQSNCKSCQNGFVNKHYAENKQYYIDKKVVRRGDIRQFVLSRSDKSECRECGENRPPCLEFHHRNPDEKVVEISTIHLTGWSMEKVFKEINKCDVLCSNCHRKLHHNMRL